MKHRNDQKVVVAYPHPGTVSARFMRCLLDLWRYDALGGRRRDGTKVGGRRRILDGGGLIEKQTALLVRARTEIVADFLTLDADWLLTLDADMTFDPDLVDRMVEAAHPTERPVVGGLCFQYLVDGPRQFWPTIFMWDGQSEALTRVTQYPGDQMVRVAATGAACMLIHRTVLEAMQAKYSGPRPWYAETPTADGTDIVSEDITFCLRAQACGFPVHVHTGIKLGHVKSFEADEEAFIAESMALAGSFEPPRAAEPTFAVIASRSRTEMLAKLRAQLANQCDRTFVFDNGYDTAPDGSIEAHGWALHRMWNEGLAMAADAADGRAHNVLVINDDVEVGPTVCADLAAGLRHADDTWISYPDDQESMTGWAFMLRGEAGLRLDEQFMWWYGDEDLARQTVAAGKRLVAVAGCHVHHLDPLRSTLENPDRLAQAEADEKAFADKWGLDPDSLWLARRRHAPVGA